MAAYTLRTETTGVRPDFDYEVTSKRRALVGDRRDPLIQRRQVNARAVRQFRLVWSGAYEAQKVLLNEAWDETQGGALPMNYTPVGDVDANAIEVRFVEDSLVIQRVGPIAYEMSVLVEEVH